ncbi:PRKR-interacting protein 1 [Intoshia linei]|uniref:PRKR-interacting protein 1 n=1 Tax=Intoshia linei TaxID=1819745 RepID=A0A177AT00_9BILA|nr:PRKR-interacting protein 1 [Intoshia linei]
MEKNTDKTSNFDAENPSSPKNDEMNPINSGDFIEKRRTPFLVKQQKKRIDKLMNNFDKTLENPNKNKEDSLPLCFQTPDIIQSVWGSSAGAGSGEFHVYRGIRRRQAAREAYLKRQLEEEEKQAEFEKQIRERKEEEDLITSKKRSKRQKTKDRKRNYKLKIMRGETQTTIPETESQLIPNKRILAPPQCENTTNTDQFENEIEFGSQPNPNIQSTTEPTPKTKKTRGMVLSFDE